MFKTVFWGIVVLMIVGKFSNTSSAEDSKAPKVIDGSQCMSSYDGSFRKLKEATEERLRDPDSFDHIETRISRGINGTTTAIMKYRARNGFGGYNVSYSSAEFNNIDCSTVKFTFE